MAEEVYETDSPEETERVAEGFARRLSPGDSVALVGELGGGKTCFVRGLARGLGHLGYVKSPSFTLLHVYTGGRMPLHHMDLYRIADDEEFFGAGLEDYVCSDGVSVIEWADRLPSLVEECTYRVRFTHTGETARRIEISGSMDG